MAEFLTFDTDLTAVANAIRAKGGHVRAADLSVWLLCRQSKRSRPVLRRRLVVTTTPGLRSQRRLQKVSRW